MHYDQKERRIWCPDCERDIDPSDAFLHIVEPYDAAYKRLQRMRAEIIEAQECALHSIAAKKLDEAWRRRKEDFRSGCTVVGRDFAIARRRGLAKER
ncbi:hypothetical protein V5F53_20670 [Xanthobacter sp. V4C-4]|uniref:hypothetical protein n=1 Tax=Xanthobacter cornucopiae TaxID=3119924 RepID=UPI00372C1895